MFKSIDHIEICTLNIEESLEFYTEILGFKIKSRRKPQMSVSSLGKSGATELAYLTLGNTTLELLEFPDAEPMRARARGRVNF
jgi:glyoxylase I family protein